MTSIDDLFRKPNAPPKRKFEDPTATFGRQAPKSAKLRNGSSPHNEPHPPSLSTNGSTSKAAFVQDEVLDEDDIEAGPAPPSEDFQEDENADEDDEGRFFGGGVTKQEREIMSYIEKNEAGEVEERIDAAWLRRTAINFERKINKNAELRAKYEDDPLKFVGSEADLDAEIKGLSLLSEHGELYPEFVKIGSVSSLMSLLAHENTDIAIAVCELVSDLTDEDSGADEEQWKLLVDTMVEQDVLSLLVSNLTRLDEEAYENDRAGVYHVLSVVENLLSEPENAERVGANDEMLSWLIGRIKKQDPNSRAKVSQNRQYAAEILAILLQGNRQNRERFARKDGVDVLLETLAAYRKRDPEKESDEEEFVENSFDCLTCAVEEKVAAEKFLEGEGMELCIIMLREGRLSKSRALKVLDHALSGGNAVATCEKLVEVQGLKTIFGMVMKSKKLEREVIEHLLGILASLLRHLPAESEGRIRTLAKFVEKEYGKIIRLAELRREYQSRLSRIDADIAKERASLSDQDEEQEAEWLSRRLDAGLFSLQTLDVIFSWLVAEDDGARRQIMELLPDGLDVLTGSLKEQLRGIDAEEGKDGESAKEMLEALLSCLGGS